LIVILKVKREGRYKKRKKRRKEEEKMRKEY
jgi:hypothetical protein